MASISEDQDQFSCSVCLDVLKDPVTVHCGHSFCMVCINDCWDQEDQKGVYSCPQCREAFTPRPVLRRNNVMAEMLEKLKKADGRAASPAQVYAGPGDVECDVCTGRKHKARESCLVCLASYCETHLKPHYQSSAFKKHKLVKASAQLQGMICPQHAKLIEIYCHTDQSVICYLCTMDEHKGHDTVSAATGRTQKQSRLNDIQIQFQQRIQENQKTLQKLKQAVNTLNCSAQTAVEDTERFFTELICFLEEKRSQMTEQIRAEERAEVSRAEELLEQLEQEIVDLKRRQAELELLSHTEDDIHFLQNFHSLSDFSGSEDYIAVHQQPSFDGVRKSLSELKEHLWEYCKEEFSKIAPRDAAVQILLPSKPKTRGDFLLYYHQLTLDPNTVNCHLVLSNNNREFTWNMRVQQYPDHLERFSSCWQVLCKESVSERCYWEVEWSGNQGVSISVSYKGITRNESVFGRNDQSWSLQFHHRLIFMHNHMQTMLAGPLPSRVGVYVDHSAGTLSFYSITDTMTLLHTVHTTFTQPLYAGFGVVDLRRGLGYVRLCDQK
ncbi:tripartite motif-containing protein 16-like [Pygocentrus nattereri]|uniref:Tripartite motif-containing protein 16-like n=1 Tax=Pygocentrus nattereri TaxID=42514 RepID=A0A3B4CWE6_PYGNA|nr:tripartite motif-containing protein 16-like [Pygocentrus nattereri]